MEGWRDGRRYGFPAAVVIGNQREKDINIPAHICKYTLHNLIAYLERQTITLIDRSRVKDRMKDDLGVY